LNIFKEVENMSKFYCDVCKVYIYDESRGDKKQGISKNTKLEDFPDNWKCPICGANASHMKLVIDDDSDDFLKNDVNIEKKTISELMIQQMVDFGVDTVFGMVGHSNLGIADALRKQEEKGKLRYVGIRHESAGAFAASAYGKLTGKPAACLSIAGPGATNLITGLFDAKLDHSPVLALVGQVPAFNFSKEAFQESDLKLTFDSVSCFNHIVYNNSDYNELMINAIKNSILKKGVSSLIFPDDTQLFKTKVEIKKNVIEKRISDNIFVSSNDKIKKVVSLISSSKKPMIIVGFGARNAIDEIIIFAEKFNIPIATTLKAKGLIADDHKLACGVLGNSGNLVSIPTMDDSDLLIVVGSSFSQYTAINENKRIVQIDNNPLSLGKHSNVEVQVLGDSKEVFKVINKSIKKVNCINQIVDIKNRKNIWNKEKNRIMSIDNNNGLNSAYIMDAISKNCPKNSIVAIDVGNNTYSFGRYFSCLNKTTTLISGILGSIGFAYPACIGAYMAMPDKNLIAITGDGGFAQYMAEMMTAVKYNIPIKHILLNNSELGKISLEQRKENMPIWQTQLHNINFSKYAKNCGALGIRVKKKDDLDKALKELFEHDGPGMIEIISDPLLY
jgi:pyruvate oxidase